MKATAADLPQGQDAYNRIVRAIRTGDLRPGDRLTETGLAAQFGISRTPVREAIRALEADGLVVHAPRLGATIRKLDHSEISELYEMRAVLAATAARHAARMASPVEIAEIAAIHSAMEAADTVEAMYRHNQQFHTAILNAARNRFLVRAVESVEKTLLILGPSTLGDRDRAAAALDEHRKILDALRAHDETAAETAMRNHIEAAHAARLRQSRDTDESDHDL